MTRIAVFFVIFHLSLLLGATAGAQVSVEVISAEVLRVGDRFYHHHGIEDEEPEGEWPTAFLRARRPI